MRWLWDALFGFCLAVLVAGGLPVKSYAANKFGEIIKWDFSTGHPEFDSKHDGVVTVSVLDIEFDKDLPNGWHVGVIAKDYGEELLAYNIEEEQDVILKFGVKEGHRFWVGLRLFDRDGNMQVPRGFGTYKFTVDFEEASYYEQYFEEWWDTYRYIRYDGEYPNMLNTKGVMYKGFLHGRNGYPYRYEKEYEYDDVDLWKVSLNKDREYKIYFDKLDDVKKAGTKFFLKFSTPSRTYNDIHHNLKYDAEKKQYYYPYKAEETGAYRIEIGGMFGRNRNILYSLGVYEEPLNGWVKIDGREYWYEDNVRQGYDLGNPSYRGKEIYDPGTDAWYWLDNVQDGAKAVDKDVYQESSGGKWVRYDSNGRMVKGWSEKDGIRCYFDTETGAMLKGLHRIGNQDYYFDNVTGGLYTGWVSSDGKDYWYEDGIQQGLEGRGKEIYDPGSDGWYWLDSIYGGAKAVGKEVYQEADGGKWVRYNANGRMIKGWYMDNGKNYYYDKITGAMQKGWVTIEGRKYHFDEVTGIQL